MFGNFGGGGGGGGEKEESPILSTSQKLNVANQSVQAVPVARGQSRKLLMLGLTFRPLLSQLKKHGTRRNEASSTILSTRTPLIGVAHLQGQGSDSHGPPRVA
uniref:Uncharacterized protein n=1 Tax=Anopheles merus TaxID=30066 RepID=A0A182V3J3_ANOME